MKKLIAFVLVSLVVGCSSESSPVDEEETGQASESLTYTGHCGITATNTLTGYCVVGGSACKASTTKVAACPIDAAATTPIRVPSICPVSFTSYDYARTCSFTK